MQNFIGKTLQDALEKASNELNVPEENLYYEVVEEKSSFLGLKKSVEISVYTDAMVVDFVCNYLKTIIEKMGLEVTLTPKYEEGLIRVKIQTNHNSILIGKAGRTLQSLNEVVRCAASATFKKRIRILLDINDYKEEKYVKLIAMAKKEAAKVRKSKITATLDPMSADERRAIHNALANFKNITTVSEGEGKKRHLTIVYKEN